MKVINNDNYSGVCTDLQQLCFYDKSWQTLPVKSQIANRLAILGYRVSVATA